MTVININIYSDILMITTHASVIIPDGNVPDGAFPTVFLRASESERRVLLSALEERTKSERKAFVIASECGHDPSLTERHIREELPIVLHDMLPLSKTEIYFEI